MVLPIEGADAEAFQRVADAHGDDMKAISARGKAAGAIHHAFYANDDGKVFVVDEWDTPENFQKFFEAEGPNIGPLMAEAGATPAAPQFLRKLDTADEF
jgi:hypothetical protein